MRLKDKVALITGGNSGIGLATARPFIDEGARVAIVGRDESRLQRAAEELGDGVLVIQADVADYNAIQSQSKRLSATSAISISFLPMQELRRPRRSAPPSQRPLQKS
jgi:NAD(P)-dependent dehydrogenase (short-subunit alcohol dehydrogenase family)